MQSMRFLATFRLFVLSSCLFALLSTADIRPLESRADEAAPAKDDDPFSKGEREHWAYLPIANPKIPEFRDESDRRWILNPVDAFILQQLKTNQLRPTQRASRRTLARRLFFDLTGLPPTPHDIDEFVNDPRPAAAAFERLVDRLLPSPHYGERWGQHWLDVVRFAETEGFEYDRHHAYAWQFRDYVIRSFNDDKPIDQFVREQLAGDEIGDADAVVHTNLKPSSESKEIELFAAVGFHRLGPVRRNAGNSDVAFSRNEVLTEMTDIIGSAFLGLTIGCARCHDHKYDAIRQKDYYRLQAFLAATHEYDLPLVDSKTAAKWEARTKSVNEEIAKLREALNSATGEAETRLRKQLTDAKSRIPGSLPSIFSVRNDAKKRTVIHLLIRGEESQKGERLGMQTLSVLLPDTVSDMPPDTSFPKTILANWVADAGNPLTARVFVNRVWQYHFGQGLVSTPNDFGTNGQPPSHPELLDYLASEFVRHDWNIKWLHRLILTSNTYQQSSRSTLAAAALKADPDNQRLWRFNRRRLQAEEVRDAMLAVSGKLNRKRFGKSVIVPVEQELVDLLYNPSQWEVTPDSRNHARRTIYLLAKRNLRLPFMEVFDQPDLQTSCGRRIASTHSPQALELLNGSLSNALADAFAKRLRQEAGTSRSAQIDLAFQLAAGRPATQIEVQFSSKFLEKNSLREFALAMFNLNAFIYVD